MVLSKHSERCRDVIRVRQKQDIDVEWADLKNFFCKPTSGDDSW